ncbi:putative reverse transcriptase domain-containing protein, partial [Tanacetum coccineum]
KNVLVRGMQILDELLTDEIQATDDYKEYEMVFGKGNKRKNNVGETSSPKKSHKITLKKRSTINTPLIPPSSDNRERDEITEATLLSLTLHKTAIATEAKENIAQVQQKLDEDEINKMIEGDTNGENEESDASVFANYVLRDNVDDDVEDFGTRIEPESKKENLKYIDDDDTVATIHMSATENVHMKDTTLNLYPTFNASSSTAKTSTADLKYHIYLTMKDKPQDQEADPELWEILKEEVLDVPDLLRWILSSSNFWEFPSFKELLDKNDVADAREPPDSRSQPDDWGFVHGCLLLVFTFKLPVSVVLGTWKLEWLALVCLECFQSLVLIRDSLIVNPMNAMNPTAAHGACFKCGSTDNYKSGCPRLNQSTKTEGELPNQVVAKTGVMVVEQRQSDTRGANSWMGSEELTKTQNNSTTQFDSGADYSFVSTMFIPLLGIKPSNLGFSYEIEIASGQLVESDKVIRGNELEIKGYTFDINLIPFGSGSFDVIIEMDWLSNHKAEIIFPMRVSGFHGQMEKCLILGERQDSTLKCEKMLND